MGTLTLIMIVGYIAFTLAVVVRMAQNWGRLWGRELLSELDSESKELESLTLSKDRALKDIKGLEFDHQIGHLTDADYKQLRRKLERRAMGFMKRIDDLQGELDYDLLIDRGLKDRFGIDFESLDASSDSAHEAATPRDGEVPCHSCGWTMSADAAFCSGCGANLKDALPATPHRCRSCHAELEPDSRFCDQCGTPTETTAVASKSPNPVKDELEVV